LSETKLAASQFFTGDGTFSRYDELGILREVRDKNGDHFIYNRTLSADTYTTSLDRGVSSIPGAKSLVSALYTLTGDLKKIELENGTQILVENGKVDKVLDSNGSETDYTYSEQQELLNGLQINRAGTEFQYEKNGFLAAVTTANGTVRRLQTDTNSDGQISDTDIVQILLETAGGDKLSDFELDSEGKIVNGIIETREGMKQKIENGILTGFETVDGKFYSVSGSQAVLTQWSLADGAEAKFSLGQLAEIVFPDGRRLHTIGFDANKQVETVTEELTARKRFTRC
jgi:hypothetical protein